MMYWRDTITKYQDDFHALRWTFIEINLKIKIDRFEMLQRDTRRHKWRTVEIWDRLDRGRNTINPQRIVVHDELRSHAKKLFVNAVEIDF